MWLMKLLGEISKDFIKQLKIGKTVWWSKQYMFRMGFHCVSQHTELDFLKFC